MRHPAFRMFTLFALCSILPLQSAQACSAQAWWVASLELYENSVAVYTAKIRALDARGQPMVELTELYGTDDRSAVAHLDVMKAWKRKRNVRDIGLSRDQRFFEDKLAIGKPYLIF